MQKSAIIYMLQKRLRWYSMFWDRIRVISVVTMIDIDIAIAIISNIV